jgi:septum formation protein
MKIVLASSSPRRSEILANVGVQFTVFPSDVEETIRDGDEPKSSVMSLSFQKAYDVFLRLESPEQIIVAADTIVVVDGHILMKPVDEDDARRMLRLMSGKTHEVYTGFSIIRGSARVVDYEVTRVTMGALSDEDIDGYIRTGESLDKAASYGIQGYGSLLVERLEGDYFNVVGLPIYRVAKTLREDFGVDLLLQQ